MCVFVFKKRFKNVTFCLDFFIANSPNVSTNQAKVSLRWQLFQYQLFSPFLKLIFRCDQAKPVGENIFQKGT